MALQLRLTWTILSVGAALALASGEAALAQYGAADGEWRHYAGDSGSSKYSPLDQIDASNFGQLEEAWRWTSPDPALADVAPYEPGMLRGTPLMVGGKLYMPTGMSQVAALDAGTGEQLWLHDPKDYERGRPVHGLVQIRGIEYWTDGTEERIFLATSNRQLVSMDLAAGTPDRKFGEDGVVDLSQNLGREDINMSSIGHSAPVIVVGDVIVVGSLVFDFPTQNNNPPGHVRGYDVRTGEFLWRFNSIPQEGEPYSETWENESWRKMGNTNVWSMMSADQELGYVYLPFGTPTSDYYGGDRHGDNVYAESLVCVDVKTGKRVWHFQTVHHGIWDYDLASAPNLIDVVVRGKKIKAVAQASKQGMLYVFDRKTGEPLWPIEERPVNAVSPVPGEKLAETQPFPTKPPPFDRIGITEDDLIDWTPELREKALEIASEFVLGPIFTPTIVKGHEGKKATIIMPGAGGGASWPGASIDPDTGILYVQSVTRPSALALAPPPRAQWRYMVSYEEIPTLDGLPIYKGPYRRITAINLNRGDFAWQVPFGEGKTQHPLVKDLDLPPMGSMFPRGVIAEGGLLITKTLLITFQAKLDELGDREADGAYLQAYDKATGELLAQVETNRSLHSSPMTYMHEGRQYIAIAGGGGKGRGEQAELIAWRLPESATRSAP